MFAPVHTRKAEPEMASSEGRDSVKLRGAFVDETDYVALVVDDCAFWPTRRQRNYCE
jgi:hypothetical protein